MFCLLFGFFLFEKKKIQKKRNSSLSLSLE